MSSEFWMVLAGILCGISLAVSFLIIFLSIKMKTSVRAWLTKSAPIEILTLFKKITWSKNWRYLLKEELMSL
jgi:hypothetical protein